MRVSRFLLPFILMASFLVRSAAQQTATTPSVQPPSGSESTAPAQATKDPQALDVLNQALTRAGGAQSISAITDYSATGTVTYHWGQDVQGSVRVRGSGLGQFRVDATLPTGVRSEIINGRIEIKGEDGALWQPHRQAPIMPSRTILPYLPLSSALNSPAVSLSYKGTTEIDGRSAQNVQLHRFVAANPDNPLRNYSTIDFFIDASTFEVLLMQDVTANHLIRQIRYSDYKTVSGILVPFSISEQVIGHPTWLIQLDQISFNTGLHDSDFQF